MLDLWEWDANKVDYLVESELESFSLFLWRSSTKTLEDEENINFNGVNIDEEEGRWLDLVFKVGEDSLVGLNAGGGPSLGWLLNIKEEEWARGWLCSTLKSYLTLENAEKNMGWLQIRILI